MCAKKKERIVIGGNQEAWEKEPIAITYDNLMAALRRMNEQIEAGVLDNSTITVVSPTVYDYIKKHKRSKDPWVDAIKDLYGGKDETT